MAENADLDVAQAHRYFSVNCFNAAWDLIDKTDRTIADNEQMIRLAHSSLWHWSQRPDCAAKNLSIGYWQVSRVYAVAEQAGNARRYGQRCLEVSPEDQPFLVGYAHEALARAASIAGDERRVHEHVEAARRYAQQITSEEDKSYLVKDLDGFDIAPGKKLDAD